MVIPDNIVSDIVLVVKDSFDALWPLILSLISINLSFYILKRIISLFPKK